MFRGCDCCDWWPIHALGDNRGPWAQIDKGLQPSRTVNQDAHKADAFKIGNLAAKDDGFAEVLGSASTDTFPLVPERLLLDLQGYGKKVQLDKHATCVQEAIKFANVCQMG